MRNFSSSGEIIDHDTQDLLPNSEALREERTASKMILIEPPRGWQSLNLGEIWQYRELLYFLAWRDVKVRYKQTLFGAGWAILQPFFAMVVFSIIFGRLIAIPTNGEPYPIFTYTALLPWTYFANAATRSGNSLIYDTNLLSKVYLPRLIIPIAAVLSALVDFFFAFIVLLGMMVFYEVAPGPAALLLPLFILLAVVLAAGVGLWSSAVNVKYRDVAYVIPILIQFWLFLTPIMYPITVVPPRWQFLYSLNPMVGVVEGFRWSLLGEQHLSGQLLALSIGVALLVFVTGLFYFRRMEFEFADVV
jgi:lipopolysaccharide transport system permease protein